MDVDHGHLGHIGHLGHMSPSGAGRFAGQTLSGQVLDALDKLDTLVTSILD
jgi:hypothetical protein